MKFRPCILIAFSLSACSGSPSGQQAPAVAVEVVSNSEARGYIGDDRDFQTMIDKNMMPMLANMRSDVCETYRQSSAECQEVMDGDLIVHATLDEAIALEGSLGLLSINRDIVPAEFNNFIQDEFNTTCAELETVTPSFFTMRQASLMSECANLLNEFYTFK